VLGEVFFTADIRHPDEAVLDAMEAAILAALAEAAKTNGLEVEQRRNRHSPANAFDAGLIECVKLGADKVGLVIRDMLCGARHDAAYRAPLVPTAMIFMPCEGGISHNESAAATLDDCGADTQVLLNAILAYDARLAETGPAQTPTAQTPEDDLS